MAFLSEGRAGATAGERLFDSLHTDKRHVERYVKNVPDKLGVSSRAGVLARPLRPA